MNPLSDREKIILQHIVEDFVRTANPVGSRYLSKKADINLSPASIRNVMSDLEEMSLLTHTHTSAGRIPTDKGYRYFVNELMENKPLSEEERLKIRHIIDEYDLSGDEIYKEISKILGKLTKELTVVSQPFFSEGIFEKLELIPISSSKVLVIVSIGAGIIRTIMFDIDSSIKEEKLHSISKILNEKLSGLSLKEIRKTFTDRIRDINNEDIKIINIFIDSIDKIFRDEREGVSLYFSSTLELLSQPEFEDTDEYKNIVRLTEKKDVVIHVLNSLYADENGLAISIGIENSDDKLKNYSIISTTYKKNNVEGKIAIIGPKRMDYSKLVSMLDYTSSVFSDKTK
jgi:heat-inducible transcriptional repressor